MAARRASALHVAVDEPAPPRAPRRRDPAGTRAAILSAAQAMMVEHGPDGLTLSDVARRAGVNRGTAYQHFATRDELVAAVLDRLFATTKRSLDARPPTSADAGLDQTVAYLVEHPALVRIAFFRLLAGVPNPRHELWADYLARVQHLAAGGRDDVDAEMLAVVLLGATLFWALRVQSGAERAADTGRYARELKRLLLYGAVAPAQHPDLVQAVHGGVKSARGQRARARQKQRRP